MFVIVSKVLLWILLTSLCVEFIATFRNWSYSARIEQRCSQPAKYYVEVVEPKLMAATAEASLPTTAPAR